MLLNKGGVPPLFIVILYYAVMLYSTNYIDYNYYGTENPNVF